MPKTRRVRGRPKHLPGVHSRHAAANIDLDTDQAGGDAGRGVTGGDRPNVSAAARHRLTAPRQPSYGAPIVLIVDDGETNRNLVEAFLSDIDCRLRTAPDGPSALAAIQEEAPDLVLLDVQMPGMNGYEVCRQIKELPRGRLLPVVMLTALDHANDRVRALEAGADDFMSKPVDRVELVARVRSALRLKALYDTLDSAEHVIFSLAAAVEAKDSYTEKHTHRVAESARMIGERMGLPERAKDALYRGGIIHDIGKIGVPDHILLKPGPLDSDELRIMQQHPLTGESIVRPLRSGVPLLPIVRHHHERVDGTGYPDGLKGRAIPHLARIVAVCDAYDALTSDRPYRRARTADEALEILSDGAGKQWDPEAIEVLVSERSHTGSVGAA
jgi:cyclic di-GMP phosphodiesterase